MPTDTEPKYKIPFKNMAPGAWVNLVLVILVFFFLLQTIAGYSRIDLCLNLGVDYCASWVAGRISTNYGYSEIYNQPLIGQYESALLSNGENQYNIIRITPYVYLPVFVLPFQALSFLDLKTSFILWSIINLVAAILYLRFFARSIQGDRPHSQLILISILSMPFFYNLFAGQTNIFLMICMGEFIRAWQAGKSLRAGIWLAGFLLKPLFLILLIPYLIFHRAYKTLGGFTMIMFIILATSYAMVGTEGFRDLYQVYIASFLGGSASCPFIMVNWRMLGYYLAMLDNNSIGWIVIAVGTLMTLAITWLITRVPLLPNRYKATAAILGILAATSAVTWHSHSPHQVMFLPLFIALSLSNQRAERLFRIWVFTPFIVILATYMIAIITRFPPITGTLVTLQIGLTGLILNLVILLWSVKECDRENSTTQLSPPAKDDASAR